MKTRTGHEIGKTYLCKYWQVRYKVVGTGFRGLGVSVIWESRETCARAAMYSKSTPWFDAKGISEHSTPVKDDPIVPHWS